MCLHLAKVIAELSEGVPVGGKAKTGEEGLVDVGGPPSVELYATLQQHLHQPHHSSVVNLDTGDFGLAGHDRQSDLLEQRKIDVNIQGLGLEPGEAIRNADELLPQLVQVLQTFVEPEVLHPVYADLDPQEGAELFIHPA